ncbi:S-adenosyl-L-methionine-dependent methyltransferases superfamily protein [Rhynchospora pubera]|uniref:S-adenosyl-L-methionine-dependent methyltransferases superfamily protein n=1 Tax=Rhynchospora pubera TaxID=906938 RepID=A0AAV8EPT8_9POAL|nr:S-adenosyl-L-methionine-dependent methyltransferases superfamily protein [Rhynchospora pubera]
MGSKDYDSSRKPSYQHAATRSKIKILLLLVLTNALSIFLFSGSGSAFGVKFWRYAPSVHVWDSEKLMLELNTTRARLSDSQSQLSALRNQLSTANSLLETLIADTKRSDQDSNNKQTGMWAREPSEELKLAMGPHKLPLGFTPNLGSDELFPTLGQACHKFQDELEKYLDYPVGGVCFSDDIFAQRLMLKGCEPLPRRRCKPPTPAGYVEPHPYPESLWSIPADTSITWDPYTCKNYACLVDRGNHPGSYDCKDCFNLFGREKDRWMRETSELDYSIDGVLALKPKGTIRIGLDIGGGSGTFAARMSERNITIVTTSMNFDGPFNSFIASRGLISMHLSVAHRLPFFDNTLDIVHSMHVLSNWIPDVMLEFTLYDIYRVLRPGGLFWLDHFFCIGTQLNSTYVPIFERIGFKQIRWNAGRKLDRGIEMNEWYLSALLEKPIS